MIKGIIIRSDKTAIPMAFDFFICRISDTLRIFTNQTMWNTVAAAMIGFVKFMPDRANE